MFIFLGNRLAYRGERPRAAFRVGALGREEDDEDGDEQEEALHRQRLVGLGDQTERNVRVTPKLRRRRLWSLVADRRLLGCSLFLRTCSYPGIYVSKAPPLREPPVWLPTLHDPDVLMYIMSAINVPFQLLLAMQVSVSSFARNWTLSAESANEEARKVLL